ncbi:hypothetical protein SAMN05660845_1871 [Flavobacterium swingsii]|uniref:Lipoprotein n=1 Tax=Flavobacterium swingsii TaxID=498292 RepID=A0A1I0YS96_9FLAO|nr:hypothetical protein [Flavobacterium swingsii]SFB15003.1 hypothetical protein SAMN05660845_1871 [Flavobacterium swingsii]
MKNVKYLFFLLFIISNYGCSQEKNNKELNFKNSIEFSIETSSNSINPLIKKINTILNNGDIESLSMNEYNNCKSTLKANKELLNQLVEIDNKINLKQKTIKYLEIVEKISDDFILPIIKHINDPNQSEIFDREKLKGGIVLVESLVSETSDLNNSLDEFCVKYKLPKKMSDFEKKDYAEKIKALKSKTSG